MLLLRIFDHSHVSEVLRKGVKYECELCLCDLELRNSGRQLALQIVMTLDGSTLFLPERPKFQQCLRQFLNFKLNIRVGDCSPILHILSLLALRLNFFINPLLLKTPIFIKLLPLMTLQGAHLCQPRGPTCLQ